MVWQCLLLNISAEIRLVSAITFNFGTKLSKINSNQFSLSVKEIFFKHYITHYDLTPFFVTKNFKCE